jgi:lipopolysaccharide/colanic/teichoic acid biosynthesis glycosyltransferase
MFAEPREAFPFVPPDPSVRTTFPSVFSIKAPLEDRWVKIVFDKTVCLLALAAASPIFFAIVVCHFVLSMCFPDQRGKLIVSYKAVSKGQVFPKYKFRVVKDAFIDKAGAARGDWQAYSAEWRPDSLTYLGVALKRSYLDELPQLFNVLLGHMSLVGPRPLCVAHYERDLAQGNNFRSLIRGGLLGPSQALKGSQAYGTPTAEYEYIDNYIRLSGPALLWYDLKLIWRGICTVARAKGL